MLLYSLFLLLFLVQRHRHSFPTRRSSDLDFFREQKINNPNKVEMIKQMESLYNDAHALWSHEEETLLDNLIERSEEHTSELQSRGHLVCRLLLEKKNEVHKIDVHPSQRWM